MGDATGPWDSEGAASEVNGAPPLTPEGRPRGRRGSGCSPGRPGLPHKHGGEQDEVTWSLMTRAVLESMEVGS